MPLLGERLAAEDLETRHERATVESVALEARFETFLQGQLEGLVERVVHRNRCGVMVGAPTLSPVVVDHSQVEIPAPHLGSTPAQSRDGSRAEGQGSESRRAAQTLLRAAVARVDRPAVDLELRAAERGNRVHHEQAVPLAAHPADVDQRLMGSRGGFGVHHRDHAHGGETIQRRGDLLGLEDLSPGPVDAPQAPADPLGDVAHAAAEKAVDADQNLVVGLNQVDQGRLHAGAAGARDRQGQGIVGPEEGAQSRLHPVHQRQEVGVQVAE